MEKVISLLVAMEITKRKIGENQTKEMFDKLKRFDLNAIPVGNVIGMTDKLLKRVLNETEYLDDYRSLSIMYRCEDFNINVQDVTFLDSTIHSGSLCYNELVQRHRFLTEYDILINSNIFKELKNEKHD